MALNRRTKVVQGFVGDFADLPAAHEVEGSFACAEDRGNAVYMSIAGSWAAMGNALKSAVAESFIAAAATFTTLTIENNAGHVRLVSAGVHGLTTSPAVGSQLYVTWSGAGVDGLYEVLAVDTTKKVTIDLAYDSGLSTPTVAVAGDTVPLASATIAGGLLGDNGVALINAVISNTNSANDKTLSVKLGATAIGSVVSTTGEGTLALVLMNRNSESAQVAFGNDTNATATMATAAIDTSADADLTFNVVAEVENEVIVLEAYLVEITAG